jgi:hypothetical protein
VWKMRVTRKLSRCWSESCKSSPEMPVANMQYGMARRGCEITSRRSLPCSKPSSYSPIMEWAIFPFKEIEDIEKRTLDIAEDFPDDLYNTYRPKGNQDVRTAAEILLHIAEQNYSWASVMRTKEKEDALRAAGKVPHSKEHHCTQQRTFRQPGYVLPRQRIGVTNFAAINKPYRTSINT